MKKKFSHSILYTHYWDVLKKKLQPEHVFSFKELESSLQMLFSLSDVGRDLPRQRRKELHFQTQLILSVSWISLHLVLDGREMLFMTVRI